MKIKSDLSAAQQQATALTTAKDQLLADASLVTLDEQTTVQGNPKAKAVIQRSGGMANQIKIAITTTMAHLHSVASDFEAVDQEGAQAIKGE
ncbi:TIGR04197 family type VII secretion effector [Streptococcus gallolyticus subsp. gallolyticus]|uniref:TIGR04197 family type VII secretion effector n=1 Tax=Streptococcus gallolyticus TaxID=315405 RepID=UPI0020018EE0|nr:TIGR04197 family type VII secretion effector [Streptococcus gallolyticus]MCY7155655.1 TIGR04197 family type VII secretion effector [Streptococcus gallolyticus subsp. gallolyticus]MCY7174412.1 TIGR04197 family type VII secretion effector [Streptococcus gallolyticus subsp. gallolyticus]MCY7176532.1 TIGR04197 family type VII secretion effector [Streptococcus gallolyticus subsp. gallolyticus]MCY7180985.1 TIGR04197 family type VII secretion effector [Streptococcus gallolyticus subsp. gallolyticus